MRTSIAASLAASLACGCAGLATAGDADRATSEPPRGGVGQRGLVARSTGPNAELRETIPIARNPRGRPRSALSLPLPPLRRGDRVRFNGEVTLTTTCVEPLPRCIGERYRFDPRITARVVLARRPRQAGRRTARVSRRVETTCQQTRPNRNHHCPLVIGTGRLTVGRPGRLPCPPRRCRLNMVVTAHHPRASGGEVVVVGADRPDGSVDGGKARLSAVVSCSDARVRSRTRSTDRRRTRILPSSRTGGHRVVYSRRLTGLRAGDVLLVRARQRTRIRGLAYFVAGKIVVSGRRRGRSASRLARRVVSREGTVTDVNGFNCTPGPSAFQSPCLTRKAGLAVIERTPRDRRGRPVPLYVNLVSRTFAKQVQARGAFPPARVLPGGGLTVRRLRAR